VARPRLLPAMEMKSRRVRLRMLEFGLVMRWAALRKEWSDWDERHGRQSREGSGDRGGSRGNQNRVACAPGCILADSPRHDKQALMPIYSRKVDVFRILFRNPLIEKNDEAAHR
jgi:hypothetical protein